jgi:aminoglycoside phosphotransferase (APT) family kinase protein
MLYDLTATDACFPDGRAPDGIYEIVAWAQSRLPGSTPWRLISARRGFGKTLFEIEEHTPSGPRRLIGRLGKPEGTEILYRALRTLHAAGFAPPGRYVVPEPIAFVVERNFVLQEKLRGEPASDLFKAPSTIRLAVEKSAEWLAALHSSEVPGPNSSPNKQAVLKWTNDLSAVVPRESVRLGEIAGAVLRELDLAPSAVVPCHGDFHPGNIFIMQRERVAGIDLDKFALREPESDIGWFLMETAFGCFKYSSFHPTQEARQAFVKRYKARSRCPIRAQRISLYAAMAFLKNLHFELVLLKTGRTEYAEPWLSAAADAILDHNLHVAI